MNNTEAKIWMNVLAPVCQRLTTSFGAELGMQLSDFLSESWIIVDSLLRTESLDSADSPHAFASAACWNYFMNKLRSSRASKNRSADFSARVRLDEVNFGCIHDLFSFDLSSVLETPELEAFEFCILGLTWGEFERESKAAPRQGWTRSSFYKQAEIAKSKVLAYMEDSEVGLSCRL